VDPEEYASIYALEDTHWWYVGMQRIVLALLDKYLPQTHGLDVLDAGCGTGSMLLALSRYGEVTGIDASGLAISYCRQRGLPRVFLASVVDLPFQDGSFDLVTSFEVLYHVNVADDVQALAEFCRVLRPGGTLCLRLPAFDWLYSDHDKIVHTRHRYTAGEVRKKVAQAGFQVLRVSYVNTLLFPVAVATRFMQRLSRSGKPPASDVRVTPSLINRVLLSILLLESRFVRVADLPTGLSVLCIAQNPTLRTLESK
jgi:SAM-dependent methyltransferase